MERPTKTITTTGGHTAVLVEYIVAAEKRQITDIYLRVAEARERGEKPKEGERPMWEAEDKSFELIVKELDGSKDAVVSRIVHTLPVTDYDEITQAVKEVIEGKKK